MPPATQVKPGAKSYPLVTAPTFKALYGRKGETRYNSDDVKAANELFIEIRDIAGRVSGSKDAINDLSDRVTTVLEGTDTLPQQATMLLQNSVKDLTQGSMKMVTAEVTCNLGMNALWARDDDNAKQEDEEIDKKALQQSYVQAPLRGEYTAIIGTQLQQAAKLLPEMKGLQKSIEKNATAGGCFIAKNPPVDPEKASKALTEAMIKLDNLLDHLKTFEKTWSKAMLSLQESVTEEQFLGEKIPGVYYGEGEH
jgi:uncharacterized phage infection (PIP) family protein YhgE